jgi:hypothetical protein
MTDMNSEFKQLGEVVMIARHHAALTDAASLVIKLNIG